MGLLRYTPPMPRVFASAMIGEPHVRELFVEEYLASGFDAAKALTRLKIVPRGAANARRAAAAFLSDTEVTSLIEARLSGYLRSAGISAERVLHELSAIAFANLSDFIVEDDEGNRRLSVLDRIRHNPRLGAAVSQVKTTETVERDGTRVIQTEFRLHDKQRALELIAKHLKMMNPQAPDGGGVDDPRFLTDERRLELVSQILNAGRARAAGSSPEPGVVSLPRSAWEDTSAEDGSGE